MGAFAFHDHAEESLTAAYKFRSEVSAVVLRLVEFRTELRLIRRRLDELSKILSALNRRAAVALDHLASRPYTAARDEQAVAETVQLVKAVIRVARAPVLNSTGDLNAETDDIVCQYRMTRSDHDGD